MLDNLMYLPLFALHGEIAVWFAVIQARRPLSGVYI